MKFELSEQDLKIIFMALGKLPLEISFDVFTKLNIQKNQDVDHSDKEL